MSEHDELDPAGTEDANAEEADVEAHGLREAAVTGLSAAALIAGAGAGESLAATSPGHASTASTQAVHRIDAANKGAALNKDAVFKGAALNKEAVFKGAALNKEAVFKGAAVNKEATFKGNAVIKLAVDKQSVDPSSRRGRDAS
jgi:hypothetical protein